MDGARHVIGCHSNQETRVLNAFDDVASTFHQSLRGGLVYVSTPGESRVTLLARNGSTLARADKISGAGLVRPTALASDGHGRE